jgi:hypothetical protein
MKKYGTDLEQEYNGVLNRIKKRAKFLTKQLKETGQEHILREWNSVESHSFPHLSDIEFTLELIKFIERKYVEQTRQLDAFD